MFRSSWGPAVLLAAFFGTLLACSSGRGPTGIDLRVVEQSPELRPTVLELLSLAGDEVRLRRQVPQSGTLDDTRPLEMRVLIDVPIAADSTRGVYVRGLRAGVPVAEAATMVAITPGQWSEVTLVLGPPTLPDVNGDDIPDELQSCARQGGCGRPDAGSPPPDAGQVPDAEPPSDGLRPEDAPTGDVMTGNDTSGPAPDVAPDLTSPVVIDAEAPLPVLSMGTGLQGELFDNVDFTAPKVTRIEPKIDFDWGYGSPDPSIAPDSFSARWRGFLEPRYSEAYTFHVRADDMFKLILDGTTVTTYTSASRSERTTVVRLTAGRKHAITIEYAELTKSAFLRWSWSSASQAKEIVPTSQLYPP